MRCVMRCAMRAFGVAVALWTYTAMAAPAAATATSAVTSSTLRLVTLAPNLTEIAFALGFGERVVGVTDYCRTPPEAATRTHLGGLQNLNLELLLTLRPSLVILPPSYRHYMPRLEQGQLRTLEVHCESIEDIYAAIAKIGGALGADERARALNERIRADLARQAEALRGLPKQRALILIAHAPGELRDLYAAGPGTFLDELLTLAGGENVLRGAGVLYPLISAETLVADPPDVIVDCWFAEGDSAAKIERNRQALQRSLDALFPSAGAAGGAAGAGRRAPRLAISTDPRLTIPGPSIAENAARMAELIHGKDFHLAVPPPSSSYPSGGPKQ